MCGICRVETRTRMHSHPGMVYTGGAFSPPHLRFSRIRRLGCRILVRLLTRVSTSCNWNGHLESSQHVRLLASCTTYCCAHNGNRMCNQKVILPHAHILSDRTIALVLTACENMDHCGGSSEQHSSKDTRKSNQKTQQTDNKTETESLVNSGVTRLRDLGMVW